MKEKNTMWIVLGLVVVAIIIFFVVRANKTDTMVGDTDTSLETPVDATEDLTEGSVNAGVSASALTYQQALVTYKDKRIQVQPSCQVIPNNVTYKTGTTIMIDNRSAVAHTMKIGSTFTVKAWGFKIIKLAPTTVPTTYLVDCDGSQNVATILVQK